MKQKEINKIIKQKKEDGSRGKIQFINMLIILAYSLAVPFLLNLLQGLVGDAISFSFYYKHFVLGGLFFIVF